MYEGILYSGIDTNEYTKPGRTYIFLNNDAVTRTNSNPTDVGFFGAYQVSGKNGTKWSDYPKDFVKDYLQYLILDGVYDHYSLPAINTVEVNPYAERKFEYIATVDHQEFGISVHSQCKFNFENKSIEFIAVQYIGLSHCLK
jgi:hypothetical protein